MTGVMIATVLPTQTFSESCNIRPYSELTRQPGRGILRAMDLAETGEAKTGPSESCKNGRFEEHGMPVKKLTFTYGEPIHGQPNLSICDDTYIHSGPVYGELIDREGTTKHRRVLARSAIARIDLDAEPVHFYYRPSPER